MNQRRALEASAAPLWIDEARDHLKIAGKHEPGLNLRMKIARKHEPDLNLRLLEFIAADGSLNEVDLLVLSPKGFYRVESKSRPGIVEGDQGPWTWRHDGRLQTVDNPLLLANRKAKKLISLLVDSRRYGRRRRVRS